MTPTKPPEAEHELAIRNARALVRPVADHAVPHDPIRVMLATALLDLHAQLTASEAALQRAIADREPPPEPVEPSDEWLLGIYAPASSLRAVYRAGRASEAAAHEETKAEAERQYIARSGAEHELERVRGQLALVDAAHVEAAAELERVRAELAELRKRLIGILAFDDETGETLGDLMDAVAADLDYEWERAQNAEGELAKLREGREEPSDEAVAAAAFEANRGRPFEPNFAFERAAEDVREYWLRVARAAKSVLLGVRRVAVPTREELAKLLLGRSHGDVPWEAFGERIRQRYLEDADAVLRLFAEADATDPAQRRAAEPTPGTVLGTARVVFRGKTEPREVEAPDSPAPAPPPEPVEPSDAWLEGLYLRNPKGIDYPDNHRESLRRVYRAGLAAAAWAKLAP